MNQKRNPFPVALMVLTAIVALMSVWPAFATKATSQPDHRPVSPITDEVILMPGSVIVSPKTENPITMKGYDVKVTVNDNLATTVIEQTIVNHSKRTLSAKYLYPLPKDADFSNFSLTINGQAVEGKIMEKEEARRTYYEIVRKVIDPGLLEFIDDKTVQLQVAPIFAGEEKVIKLSYTQLLKQDGGLYKYQYSFGARTGQEIPVNNANLTMDLKTSQNLKTIYSPTHSPTVSRKGNKQAEVVLNLQKAAQLLEKNFVLYFSEDNQAISLNSLAFKESADENGYFLMTIKAPKELTSQKALPKDIVLVIDTSGSMSGEKIVQAKEALKYIVNHLNAEDRFNIVQFNTDVSRFREEMMSATAQNKQAALEYVSGLDANGSTHIENALKTAFGQLPSSTPARPDYVIFLTDGEPTVGITDTPSLLDVAKQANTTQAKLFNFGVGYDVKTDLLGKLADHHHGSTTYVEPNENLELALTSFYNKIEAPVLTNVKVDFGRFRVSSIYPAEIGDLFAGSEIILLGRFENAGSDKITLSGKVGNEHRSFTYPVAWEAKPATLHANLPRLWAGRRIGYLLDSIHQNGETSEVKNEVIALSKRYGIMTPYTSFLAVEPKYASKEDERGMAGGGRYQYPTAAPMSSMDNFKRSTGKGAIQLQKSLGALKQQANVADMNEAQLSSVPGTTLGVQTLDKKTFILSKDNVWTDSEYDEAKHGKPVKVTFGTPEYFQLLTDKPELAKFFSLGQQVLVLFEGKAYQVVASQAS